jgi:hypothetical protein
MYLPANSRLTIYQLASLPHLRSRRPRCGTFRACHIGRKSHRDNGGPYLKPWISCCTYFFPSPCENTRKPRAPSIGDQTPHTAITIFVCDCSRVINKSCDIALRLSYVPMYECQRSEPVPIPTHLRRSGTGGLKLRTASQPNGRGPI